MPVRHCSGKITTTAERNRIKTRRNSFNTSSRSDSSLVRSSSSSKLTNIRKEGGWLWKQERWRDSYQDERERQLLALC